MVSLLILQRRLQEFSLFKKACDDKLKAEQEVSHALLLLLAL
jgi:hypothetical protein